MAHNLVVGFFGLAEKSDFLFHFAIDRALLGSSGPHLHSVLEDSVDVEAGFGLTVVALGLTSQEFLAFLEIYKEAFQLGQCLVWAASQNGLNVAFQLAWLVRMYQSVFFAHLVCYLIVVV